MEDDRIEGNETEIDVEGMIESRKCKRALALIGSINNQITLIEMKLNAGLVSSEGLNLKETARDGEECEIVERLYSLCDRIIELKHRIKL